METNNSEIENKLIPNLLKSINDREELNDYTKVLSHHMCLSLNECLKESLQLYDKVSETTLLKVDSVLDFIDDEINIGHWSEIPLELRRAYTVTSFVKMLLNLQFHKNNLEVGKCREILTSIDRGILMGAPLENNEVLLTRSASLLSNYISKLSNNSAMLIQKSEEQSTENIEIKKQQKDYITFFNTLVASNLNSIVLPSLEYFNKSYFIRQQPVKLQGCINHWPAIKKWKDLNYLLHISGDRTVPVEIGTQYVDENWSQKLMTVKEFIEAYYLSNEGSIGYLAQHNLLDQIPELKNDICIPEYCSLSMDYEKSCDPDINCWFGPAGTVSSLHYDPKNNLLAQVYGTKQVLLFPPDHGEFLYPYNGTLLRNTSQVDPMIPNLQLYPNFVKAKMYKCLLTEGEMLFIPEKWWHHVIALEKSFSVSFWWQ